MDEIVRAGGHIYIHLLHVWYEAAGASGRKQYIESTRLKREGFKE